ncbi:tetratricopeptide repeat protein [Rhodoferax sp.]|uniref:tetratricopeptide repeat protein n=1 Tax=Rhodoferax sp. TaxID=50421 RepID=UPI002ACD4C21|nr:tetratricopeptide repeat protein [Rhodoferax sp.]MDZ7919519.1 tetratricopeptide repeat protein [Rhodoferax sp.]
MTFEFNPAKQRKLRGCYFVIVGVACFAVSTTAVPADKVTTACRVPNVQAQVASNGDRDAPAYANLAMKTLTRSAAQGDRSAQAELGRAYLEGNSVPRDISAAGAWFLRAAEQGDMDAQIQLSAIYTHGMGVPKDRFEASYWKVQAYPHELVKMREALAVEVNPLPARAWRASMQEYLPHAEKGNSLAQYAVGRMYLAASREYLDHEVAVEWLEKAATHGHVKAAIDLAGILAIRGETSTELENSLFWFRYAVTQNRVATAKAMYEVGIKVQKKRGGMTVFWLSRAAELGNANAQNDLGRIYETGNGVEQDFASAVVWYRRAADQDLPEAQYALAQMYLEGRGVPKDVDAAYFWWALSAKTSAVCKDISEGDGISADMGKPYFACSMFERKGYIGGEMNASGFWNSRLQGSQEKLRMALTNWRPNLSGNKLLPSSNFDALCELDE